MSSRSATSLLPTTSHASCSRARHPIVLGGGALLRPREPRRALVGPLPRERTRSIGVGRRARDAVDDLVLRGRDRFAHRLGDRGVVRITWSEEYPKRSARRLLRRAESRYL